MTAGTSTGEFKTDKRQKILLVDDLQENLSLLTKTLASLEVEILSAESGEVALSLAPHHDFAVMILDVIMPGMNGYELASELRKLPNSGKVPIILITGGDPDDREIARGYEIGALDYIVKPFTTAVLTHKVEKILEIDRNLRELEAQRRALQENESERFRMLFENMPSGFSLHEMIYDREGKAADYTFLEVNPSFERLTGLKKSEVIGKTALEVLPHIEPYWIERYAQVVASGEPSVFEEHSKELGKYYSVRSFRAGENRFAVVFTDVTERRRSEEDLKLTQFTVDHFRDAVYWADLNGKFTYVNDAACRDLGYSREELLEKHVWDIDPDVTPENWPLSVKDFQEKGDVMLSQTHQRKDGSRYPVEVKANYFEFMGKKLVCGLAHNVTDREAAREKLESSQRLLRSIIDSIPIRIFWKDRHSVYLGANAAFARDAGVDHPDDLIGKTDQEMPWKPEQTQWYLQDDQRIIQSGKPELDYEERQTWSDGTEHWIKTNKIPLTNREGETIGVLGAYEEITEQKQMHEAIEKRVLALTQPLGDPSEIAFDELFSLKEIQKIQDDFAAATHVASVILSPEGEPITEPSNFKELCRDLRSETNKSCIECMKGLRDGSSNAPPFPCAGIQLWNAKARITVGGKEIANWIIGQVRDQEADEATLRESASAVGHEKESFLREILQLPAMSREKFQKISEALNTLANQLSHTAYQNLQQARFIEQEKRRTQEFRLLSTALEQSPEVIVITNLEGTIEYANPAFARSTGYSCEEALGKNPSILKSGKHTAAFYQDMWKTLSAGKVWSGRIINKRKDGSLYTEEAVISPVKSPEGKITNYVAVKRDITDELDREEKMQQAQKMEAVGQLAGGIAHDFNNILQTIIGFSDLLMLNLEPYATETRQQVSQIQKAAQHAADLTRQLLAFSRKQHAVFTPVDLNHLLEHCGQFISSILGENISISRHLSPHLHKVHADMRQLERVVLNMALNSKDAMPEGGEFRLVTKNLTLQQKDLPATSECKPGEYVCLEIRDTGNGIPGHLQSRIFEPFFTTKEPGKGTGLGLAAIYGIISRHHGWIEVESEPGKGSVFNIFLPAILEEADVEETPPSASDSYTASGKGERILVVEDEATVRELMENTLQSAGYTLKSAGSAEEAESLFLQEDGNFDLLISDVILPRKNGADLAVDLRKIKPELRVLLCSGYSGSRVEKASTALQDFTFLEKPFSFRSLLQKVEAILHTSTSE